MRYEGAIGRVLAAAALTAVVVGCTVTTTSTKASKPTETNEPASTEAPQGPTDPAPAPAPTDVSAPAPGSTDGPAPAPGPGSSDVQILEDALPSPENLGPGWTQVPYESDDTANAAVRSACPDLTGFFTDDTSHQAIRSFQHQSGIGVTMRLDLYNNGLAEPGAPATLVGLYNACRTSIDLGGAQVDVSFTAQANDSLGPNGVVAIATIQGQSAAGPLALRAYQFMAVASNGVLVTFETQDTADENGSLNQVPEGALSEFAAMLPQAVQEVGAL